MTTASTDMEETEVREADGTATPQWLFDLLDDQVKALTGQGFQLDAAASDWNAKCADYFDEQTDALQQDWSRSPTIFCNPPFCAELIKQFVTKAIEAAEKGSTVVLVLPSWPGFEWFQELKRRGQVQDVVGPIHFEHHDGRKVTLNSGRKTSSIVVVTLGPRIVPGTNGGPIHHPSRNGWATEAPAGGTRPSRSKPLLCRLSELSPETTEWLWHLRIPKGELTVVDGDPSVNKSSLLLDIAARVSTGRAMPDGTAGTLGGVLLLLGEDSLRKTVLQRLQAADADLNRIAAPDRLVTIPDDVSLVEKWACETRASLLVIDPLMAFLACDSNSDQKVRRALHPLLRLAEERNMAVVMVRHLTKRGGRHALYRGGGSIGIIAATRSALLVGKAPDDPDLRVLCQPKTNLGPSAPSLLFEPVPAANGVVQIQWRGECDYAPEDVLAPQTPSTSRIAEAMNFLTDLLADGPRSQQAIKEKAAAAGLAYRTLERAKELLGVKSERHGWGPGSKCFWRLPTEDGEAAADHSTPSAPVALYEPGTEEQPGDQDGVEQAEPLGSSHIPETAPERLPTTDGDAVRCADSEDSGYDDPPANDTPDDFNFYPTPPWVTEELLRREKFGSVVWEPACGDGAISKVLEAEGYTVHSSDIKDRGFGEVLDFFKAQRTVESIVTNPDYSRAEEFVRKALASTTYKVAMFLRASFFESQRRAPLFAEHPPKRIYVFARRVSLFPGGERGDSSGGQAMYAWFVWEHGFKGETTIQRIE
jgi:phage N-6-adenine-methyltransferase